MSKNQEKIEDLINATQDPVARAILLVLSNIDYALTKNTEATQSVIDTFAEHRKDFDLHRNEFRSHVAEEHSLISGIKAAWWAATTMGAAIIWLAGYIIVSQATQLEKDSGQIRVNTLRLGVIENKVGELERRQQFDEQLRTGGK